VHCNRRSAVGNAIIPPPLAQGSALYNTLYLYPISSYRCENRGQCDSLSSVCVVCGPQRLLLASLGPLMVAWWGVVCLCPCYYACVAGLMWLWLSLWMWLCVESPRLCGTSSPGRLSRSARRRTSPSCCPSYFSHSTSSYSGSTIEYGIGVTLL
jgi:hypothetical protein